MSQTVKTKLRGFVAAFTALVLTLALVPTAAFAALTQVEGENDQNGDTYGEVLTGSILIEGITTDDLNDTDGLSITLYKVADILVNSSNVPIWMAVDDEVGTTTATAETPQLTSTLAQAISEWRTTTNSTNAQAIVNALNLDSNGDSSITDVEKIVVSSNTAETSGSNLLINDLEPGIYYIKVVDNDPESTTTYQTIIVSVELIRDDTNANGNNWTVETKTITLKSVDGANFLKKDVLNDTNTSGVYTTNDTITFVASVSINSSMSDFYITDAMTGLSYNQDLTVYYVSGVSTIDDFKSAWGSGSTAQTGFTGQAVSSGNYTLTSSTVTNGSLGENSFTGTGIDSDTVVGSTFTLTFSQTNLETIVETYNSSEVTLFLVYSADVLSTASTTGIYNNIWSNATYPNGNGPGVGDDPSDPNNPNNPDDPTTVVIAAGITINKIDANDEDKFLAGATFEIYLAVWDDTLNDGEGGYTYDDTANPIDTITTGDGEDGTTLGVASTAKNLKAGATYVLVETVAPSGYIWTEAGGLSYCTLDTENENFKNGYLTFKVENTSYDDYDEEDQDPSWGFNLPTTGGMGTIIFTVVGVLVMAGAAYLIIRSRKQHLQD